jgi:hypothetical protein
MRKTTEKKEHMTFIEHDGCFIVVCSDVFESNFDCTLPL